jgi:hypothetical protein
MDLESERIRILERIESGEISAEHGIELLRQLDQRQDMPGEAMPADEFVASQAGPIVQMDPGVNAEDQYSSPPPPSEFQHWKRFWWIPLWVGVGVTIFVGLLMSLTWMLSGFGFCFACLWLPFLIGVALVALGWASRRMRWLHLRVNQKPGEWPQRIALSFPLPLGLAAWGVRTFGRWIPKVRDMPVEQMITALENTSPDAPFYMDVDDDEDGEHVQIFIG